MLPSATRFAEKPLELDIPITITRCSACASPIRRRPPCMCPPLCARAPAPGDLLLRDRVTRTWPGDARVLEPCHPVPRQQRPPSATVRGARRNVVTANTPGARHPPSVSRSVANQPEVHPAPLRPQLRAPEPLPRGDGAHRMSERERSARPNPVRAGGLGRRPRRLGPPRAADVPPGGVDHEARGRPLLVVNHEAPLLPAHHGLSRPPLNTAYISTRSSKQCPSPRGYAHRLGHASQRVARVTEGDPERRVFRGPAPPWPGRAGARADGALGVVEALDDPEPPAALASPSNSTAALIHPAHALSSSVARVGAAAFIGARIRTKRPTRHRFALPSARRWSIWSLLTLRVGKAEPRDSARRRRAWRREAWTDSGGIDEDEDDVWSARGRTATRASAGGM